jgi:two-component system CheB/CheR fusion protein
VRGSAEGADLGELARAQLTPFMSDGRLKIAGASVSLDSSVAIPMALTFNELATNAIKYGSLSAAGGKVWLTWDLRQMDGGEVLTVSWREADGPPVRPPSRLGLGSRLIDRGIPNAKVERRFEPTGFTCAIEVPRPRFV